MPVDGDLADGDPTALVHVEHDPDPAAVLRQLQRLDLRGVVARVLVQGIDRGAGLLHGVAVERPALDQLDPALHRSLGDPIRAAHGPALQHRALLHLEREHQLVAHGPLLHQDVVELAGAEEIGDGALDVPIVHRLPHDETGGADDLGRGETRIALDGDAVDDGRSHRLGLRLLGSERRRASQQESDGGAERAETLHQHWVRSGRAGPRAGAGAGDVRPWSRSGPGRPAARRRARHPPRSRRPGRTRPGGSSR